MLTVFFELGSQDQCSVAKEIDWVSRQIDKSAYDLVKSKIAPIMVAKRYKKSASN